MSLSSNQSSSNLKSTLVGSKTKTMSSSMYALAGGNKKPSNSGSLAGSGGGKSINGKKSGGTFNSLSSLSSSSSR